MFNKNSDYFIIKITNNNEETIHKLTMELHCDIHDMVNRAISERFHYIQPLRLFKSDKKHWCNFYKAKKEGYHYNFYYFTQIKIIIIDNNNEQINYTKLLLK